MKKRPRLAHLKKVSSRIFAIYKSEKNRKKHLKFIYDFGSQLRLQCDQMME